MKVADYKQEDIAEVMEMKKIALHQNELIEMNIWTDSIDEAIARTLNQYQALQKIRVMKSAKAYESRLHELCKDLKANGVSIQVIRPIFTQRKTD